MSTSNSFDNATHISGVQSLIYDVATQHLRLAPNTQQYVFVKLYYDSYEKNFGDGFYPVTVCNTPCTEEVTIKFAVPIENGNWVQIDKDKIMGLDGDEGIKLLAILNSLVPTTKQGIGITNWSNALVYIEKCRSN